MAWFINKVNKWFFLMTSRHLVLALSKLKPEMYESSITFYNDKYRSRIQKNLETFSKRFNTSNFIDFRHSKNLLRREFIKNL